MIKKHTTSLSFENMQKTLIGDNPWEIEHKLSPADRGYLNLLSAVYVQAIDDMRRSTSVDAAQFIKSDPYGFLTDDLKSQILWGAKK